MTHFVPKRPRLAFVSRTSSLQHQSSVTSHPVPMTFWTDLPAEIKLLIIHHYIHSSLVKTGPPETTPNIAARSVPINDIIRLAQALPTLRLDILECCYVLCFRTQAPTAVQEWELAKQRCTTHSWSVFEETIECLIDGYYGLWLGWWPLQDRRQWESRRWTDPDRGCKTKSSV